MKLPFNPWPAGIITVFALFVCGTIGLVVLASTNRVELVSPDYYEQELRYQQRLDGLNRTHRLAPEAKISFDAGRKAITVALPAQHARQQARGQVTLLRPSAAGLDRRIPLALEADGIQRLDASSLPQGRWNVRVEWRVGDEDFCLEERVDVKTGS